MSATVHDSALWPRQLNAIAQLGQVFAQESLEKEWFPLLRGLTRQLLPGGEDLAPADVRSLFYDEEGSVSLKLRTVVAVFNGPEILLLQERASGLWTMPCGQVDIRRPFGSLAVQVAQAQTGYHVLATRLAALASPGSGQSLCKVVVLCEMIGGSHVENDRYARAGFFSADALPALAPGAPSPEEIALCVHAYENPGWVAQVKI